MVLWYKSVGRCLSSDFFCVNCLIFGLFCSAKYKVSKDSLVEHQITGIMAMKCKWNNVFITMVVEDTIVLNPGCGPWVPQHFWAIVTDIRLLSRKVLSKVKRFKGLRYMKKFDFWHYKWIFLIFDKGQRSWMRSAFVQNEVWICSVFWKNESAISLLFGESSLIMRFLRNLQLNVYTLSGGDLVKMRRIIIIPDRAIMAFDCLYIDQRYVHMLILSAPANKHDAQTLFFYFLKTL